MNLIKVTKRDNREPFFIFVLFIGIGLSLAIYLYGLDRFSLLYYSDSVSHLVRSRELFDSVSPGFQQIGTVWLPLPHFLLLPFSLLDPLFKTGFAGLAVSLPSLAITSAILYKMIRIQTKVSYIAVAGALLFFLNPNIVYLGITAMTEAPFMLFFVAAAYYFQKSLNLSEFLSHKKNTDTFVSPNYLLYSSNNNSCCSTTRRRRRSSSRKSSEYKFSMSSDLIKCSVFVVLATLCRYEAWLIPFFLVSFVVWMITTTRTRTRTTTTTKNYQTNYCKIKMALISSLSFSGIVLWILYNAYYYGNPLEFFDAPYYSAASQALEGGGENRANLYLRPFNVISLYSLTALAMYGPIIMAAAIIGYLFHKRSGPKEEIKKRDITYLFLALPSIATLLALVFGIGEMNQLWFNSRFLTLVSPLVILLCCMLVKIIIAIEWLRNNSIIVIAAIIAILFFYPIIALPAFGAVVTFIDAKNSMSYGTRPAAMDIAQALSSYYNSGNILLITGSAQQNIIMQASGITLSNFQTATEGSTWGWKNSLQKLQLHTKYVVLSKQPDPSAERVIDYWMERQNELKKYFSKVYENSYYFLLIANKSVH